MASEPTNPKTMPEEGDIVAVPFRKDFTYYGKVRRGEEGQLEIEVNEFGNTIYLSDAYGPVEIIRKENP